LFDVTDWIAHDKSFSGIVSVNDCYDFEDLFMCNWIFECSEDGEEWLTNGIRSKGRAKLSMATGKALDSTPEYLHKLKRVNDNLMHVESL
jgi:hypothetical protein